MNWNGVKVLVTGAGGFIGSHLAERLLELGAEVRAMVHYNALGLAGWLDKSRVRQSLEIVAGDICDRDSVANAVCGREVVFHLAALIAIPYSYRAPESYLRTNGMGTLNVLQSARLHDVRCLIHTSTSEVYGTARYVPIDEKHPLQGQSPYSASKIAADKMAEAFHLSFQLPVVTVRPFNTFGPRQSARAIIPTVITQLARGDKVHLGSLNPTRDFNYVADTVEGFIAAASNPAARGQTFNLGRGQDVSVQDTARLIAELMKKPMDIVSEQERVRPDGSEVQQLVADSRRAKEVLGWVPKVGFEEGLCHTIDWFMATGTGSTRDGYVI